MSELDHALTRQCLEIARAQRDRAWLLLESTEAQVAALRAENLRLKEAAKECLCVMGIQEKRSEGLFHLSAQAFVPMWQRAKDMARRALQEVEGSTNSGTNSSGAKCPPINLADMTTWRRFDADGNCETCGRADREHEGAVIPGTTPTSEEKGE